MEKVALVTAASRGIGLACGEALARRGVKVYLGVRRVAELQGYCDKQRAAGLILAPVYFDAARPETCASMVQTVLQQAQRLDILVNNFGVGRPAEDLDLVGGDEQAFFDLLKANVGTVYRVCRAAIPTMFGRGGAIVNVSSIGGRVPDVTRLGYGVSKAAVNNLTLQIAVQYARRGIRCNAVLPGLTATDAVTRNLPAAFVENFLAHVPLGRMGTPEDVANAVAFLAGDEAAFITGQMLEVAGGYGIPTPQYGELMRAQ